MDKALNIDLAAVKFGHEYKGAGSVNVRKTAPTADVDSLVASIKAEGLLQPLAVLDREGIYYVVDGNRRLAALKKIGKPIPPSWLHIIEADTIEAAQAKGLAANVLALPLNEVDRFEAFGALMHQFSVGQIATRFGITDKQVERSLALAKLSARIRDALRKGEIQSEAARAFTIEPDPKRQESIYDRLKKQGQWTLQRWQIRQAILGDQNDVANMMKFVGEEAAKAAGVGVVTDLFAEKNERAGVVTNVGALEKLVSAKITKAKADLMDEGWGSVVMDDSLEFGWRNWKRTPSAKGEDRKKLMVVLELKNGTLVKHLGIHKSKQRETVEKTAEKRKANPNTISNALKDRLEQQLIHATVAAIKAEAWKDPRMEIFAAIVAKDIDRHRFVAQMPDYVGSKLTAIRECISPKVMQAALVKAFDPKEFFPRAPKSVVLKAIEEAGCAADQLTKLKAGTKAAAWKFALANVPKTWLPPQMRLKGYTAPSAKG